MTEIMPRAAWLGTHNGEFPSRVSEHCPQTQECEDDSGGVDGSVGSEPGVREHRSGVTGDCDPQWYQQKERHHHQDS